MILKSPLYFGRQHLQLIPVDKMLESHRLMETTGEKWWCRIGG
jgi:hypothetical protein